MTVSQDKQSVAGIAKIDIPQGSFLTIEREGDHYRLTASAPIPAMLRAIPGLTTADRLPIPCRQVTT